MFLARAVELENEAQNGNFRHRSTRTLATPIQELSEYLASVAQ